MSKKIERLQLSKLELLVDTEYPLMEGTYQDLIHEFNEMEKSYSGSKMERRELTFHNQIKLLGLLTAHTNEIQGDILEIGVWKGVSLALMKRVAKSNSKVIGVDPCELSNQKEELNYFHKYIFSDAHLIYEYSENAFMRVANLSTGLRLLHIDGGHKMINVLVDFFLYSRLVVPGGYIVFDDYSDAVNSPEVRVAVDLIVSHLHDGRFIVLNGLSKFPNSFVLQRGLES